MADAVVTSGQLAKLRSNGQQARLYCAILPPSTIYTARVNQTFTSNNGIAEITYDGGSGALIDVEPGMTMYVGSTAGAYDVGQVRIRKDPTATVFYIGETSEIDWEDDLYLTVVASFDPWQKHIRLVGTEPLIDYDIAYSDQHSDWAPCPCLGSDAVAWLPTGGTVDVDFRASASWDVPGSFLSFSWSAPGASASIGTATATPTFTYNAAGRYRVSCTVTGATGKSSTGWRDVYVFSAASSPPEVEISRMPTSNFYTGGYSFQITMHSDDADLSAVRDREKVVLFARDWYNGVEESLGPVSDRENIIAMGWIAGETIRWSAGQSSVTFDVQGPHYWINKELSFPVGVVDAGLPSATSFNGWLKVTDLTLKKGLFHLFHYRSTLTAITDIFICDISGDTRLIGGLETPNATLWQQIVGMADAILATPCSDRYGAIYVDENVQVMELPRSPTEVMEITSQDWRDVINIQRRVVPEVGQVFLAGVLYLGSGSALPYCARAYGDVPAHYGGLDDSITTAALIDADHAARLAGRLMAWKNNEYPVISIPLAANNRFIDVAPQQFVTLPVAASDTVRGIEISSSIHFIPRAISYNYDPKAGALTVDIEVEMETFGTHAITTNCPTQPEREPETSGGDDPDYPDQPTLPAPEIGGLVQNCVVLGSQAIFPLNRGDVGNSALSIETEETININSITGAEATEPWSMVSNDGKVYHQLYLAVTGGFTYTLKEWNIETEAYTGTVVICDAVTPAIESRNHWCIPEQGYGIIAYRTDLYGSIYVDLADFDAGSKSTLFSYAQDPSGFGNPWYYKPDAVIAAEYDGQQKLLVFNLRWDDDGTDDVYKLQCRILDKGESGWAAGTPTLLEETFASGDYIDSVFLYAPPVLIGKYVVLSYSVDWDDGNQRQPFFVVDLENDTMTEYVFSTAGHSAWSQIYNMQPYHSKNRVYFTILYPTGLIDEGIGWIDPATGSITIQSGDAGENRTLISDQVKAYIVEDGLLTNERIVLDAFDESELTAFTASRASLSPTDGLSVSVDDDTIQRVWYYKHADSTLLGVPFDIGESTVVLTTSISVPASDTKFFVSLQGSKFLIVERKNSISTKYQKLYIVQQDPDA